MHKHTLIAALLLLLLACCALGVSDLDFRRGEKRFLERTAKQPDVHVLPSGLMYTVLKSGPAGGKSPNETTPCLCHYRGSLTNGQQFDSSYDRSAPMEFTLKSVIKGWREILPMMKEGDMWKVYVPPALGYSEAGFGKDIPPGAVLIFELNLEQVLPPPLPSTSSSVDIGGGFFKLSPAVIVSILVVIACVLTKLVYNNWMTGRLFGFGGFGGFGGGSGRLAPIVEPIIPLSVASVPDTDPVVWMDIVAGERLLGRIEIQLFASIVPKSARNFLLLCTGEKGVSKKSGGIGGGGNKSSSSSSSTQLHYKGCPIHRILPRLALQTGDIQNGDGSGEPVSAVNDDNEPFEDEYTNGTIKHTCRGMVSWAPSPPPPPGKKQVNGSQFFITFAKRAHWMDGLHCVFGRVIKGLPILDFVECLAATPEGKPAVRVFVGDCGVVK